MFPFNRVPFRVLTHSNLGGGCHTSVLSLGRSSLCTRIVWHTAPGQAEELAKTEAPALDVSAPFAASASSASLASFATAAVPASSAPPAPSAPSATADASASAASALAPPEAEKLGCKLTKSVGCRMLWVLGSTRSGPKHGPVCIVAWHVVTCEFFRRAIAKRLT